MNFDHVKLKIKRETAPDRLLVSLLPAFFPVLESQPSPSPDLASVPKRFPLGNGLEELGGRIVHPNLHTLVPVPSLIQRYFPAPMAERAAREAFASFVSKNVDSFFFKARSFGAKPFLNSEGTVGFIY